MARCEARSSAAAAPGGLAGSARLPDRCRLTGVSGATAIPWPVPRGRSPLDRTNGTRNTKTPDMDSEFAPGDVTRLLRAAREGDDDAINELLPLVYDQLRALARRQMRRERSDHTLDATALVHEAYLKMAGGSFDAGDRGHFLAIAARAMRQVLVDHARTRDAAKRGGGWSRTTLADGHRAVGFDPDELIELDRALDELEPRQRKVVELRFFAGMEEREVAAVLGVTDRTVRRDWVKARAWLYRSLYPDAGPDEVDRGAS